MNKIKFILLWNLLFCFATGIEAVLYALYAQALLNDTMSVGKLISLGLFFQAITFIVAGYLNDRIGTKMNLMIGIAFMFIGYLGAPFVATLSLLVLFRIIMNIGWAFILVSFAPILSENAPSDSRVRLFSIAYGSGTFATFIGTLCGGVFADAFQLLLDKTQLESYRMVLLLAALIMLISILPLLFVSRTQSNKRGVGQRSMLHTLKENRDSLSTLLQYCISRFLSGVSLGLFLPFVTLFFYQRYMANNSLIGIIAAIATLVTVGFISFNPSFVKRWNELKTVVAYNLLSALFLILIVISNQIVLTALFFVLYRALRFAANPIESSLLMSKMNEKLKGTANSIGLVSYTIGMSAMGSVSMYVVTSLGLYWGYVWIGIIASSLSILSTVYLYRSFRVKKSVRAAITQPTNNATSVSS